jgi:glucokinase
MRKYRTREHAGLASAWAAFARDCGGELPRAASFGVAAPIDGEVLRFVNSDWKIDRGRVAEELGLDRLLLLNDFGAVAHAVSILPPDALSLLAGPTGDLPEDGITTVLGPGTGLGVAILSRRGGRVEVIETEGAHIAFAPQTAVEGEIARAVRARHGRCSVERIVSGPGLFEIYASLGRSDSDAPDAGILWATALDGTDPLASESLDILIGCLGAAAGDLSLAHGSMLVVITGGLANRMAARLRTPLFADRFIDKGRYRERMTRIPILLATTEEPGLLGAAVAMQIDLTR